MSNRVSRNRLPLVQLLAVAALATMGSAHAQSSVQAYGLVDMSAGKFQSAGAVSDKAVQSGNMSTSYIGFGGKEDLGGGLSAKFALESFLRADSGSAGRFTGDAFWARAANAGLVGSFGTVTLGRNTPALFVSTLVFNAFGDSFGYSPSIRHYYTSGTVTGDSGWNQSISYVSPNLGGLSAQVQVAGNDGTSFGRKTGGNVLYFSGAFAGTVAYQKVKAGSNDGTTTSQVGASYNFGPAKLFAQYGKVTNDTVATKTSKLADVGVSVPVGNGKVLVQYGQVKFDNAAKTKLTTVTAGYDYDLSKRSDLYVVAMSDKATAKSTGSTFAVGLRHKF
jgi:predicted porin